MLTSISEYNQSLRLTNRTLSRWQTMFAFFTETCQIIFKANELVGSYMVKTL